MYIWNGAYVLGGMYALLFNITYYVFVTFLQSELL